MEEKKIEYAKLREELKKYSIHLDKNPTNKSLSILYNKLEEVEAAIERVGEILSESLRNKCKREIEFSEVEQKRKALVDLLFFSDEKLKDLKNAELRNSHISQNENMKVLLPEISEKEISLMKATTFLSEVRIKFDELLSKRDSTSRQITLIKLILGIGETPEKQTIE